MKSAYLAHENLLSGIRVDAENLDDALLKIGALHSEYGEAVRRLMQDLVAPVLRHAENPDLLAKSLAASLAYARDKENENQWVELMNAAYDHAEKCATPHGREAAEVIARAGDYIAFNDILGPYFAAYDAARVHAEAAAATKRSWREAFQEARAEQVSIVIEWLKEWG